jgi:hypothetical protein
MRISRPLFFLLCVLALPGCDKLKGIGGKAPPDPKVLDAEAIGYACRVSQKSPEDCMKENDGQSPSSVLNGWKKADADIKAKVIDISMGKPPAPMLEPAAEASPGNKTPAAPAEQRK